MKISVLGLGYIGLPTAIIFAENGHEVCGFDVSEKVIDCLNAGHIHIVEAGLQEDFERVLKDGSFRAYKELQESDVYIISVPTPFKQGEREKIADMKFVESATKIVASKLKKGDLVVLESTCPPLSTRRMTDQLCELTGFARDEFDTVHCPERVLPGHIMYEMQHNDRIIGAERKEAGERAKKLYESFLTEGKAYVTDDVTAEMCKLVENSFRDVNIAFANELSIICDKLGIDVKELITLANKHPRVNILSPGVGVGGHCLAVDPWFIVEKFKNEAQVIGASRVVNDNKPIYLAGKIDGILAGDKSKKVAVLGMSYKPDIDDFRESPSVVLCHELAAHGYTVVGCDPNCRTADIEGIPVETLDTVLETADLIIVAQNDKEFKDRAAELAKAGAMYV